MKTRNLLILIIAVMIALAAVDANAQTQCPPDMVCISNAAATKALQDADKVIALEAEIKTKDEVINGYRDEANKLRVELARVSGEKTQLELERVRIYAILEIALKNTRKRSFGVIAM